MAEIACIEECQVTYNDGRIEVRRPTFHEIALGIASVNVISILDYLRQNLKDVKDIKVIDILYFKSREDYIKYLDN
jgi:hypothetical protein